MNGYDQSMLSPASLQQQQQQQLQTPGSDLEAARLSYRSALADLTFNSKPIITGLTIKAQENQFAAGAIVREIEHQITTNAPGQKLPVLYLIDSICKNVGGQYVNYFARNIVSIFMDTYTLVDVATRKSIERLLQTWKNGMPNGAPVFARHLIDSIERAINFIQQRQAPPSSQPLPPQQQQPQPQPHPQQRLQQQQQLPPQQQGTYSPSSSKSRDPRSRAKLNPQEQSGISTPTLVPPPVVSPAPVAPTHSSTVYNAPSPSNPLGQLLSQFVPSNPVQPNATYVPSPPPPQHQHMMPASVPVSSAMHSQTPNQTSTLPSLNTTELLKGLMSQGLLHPSVTNAASANSSSVSAPPPTLPNSANSSHPELTDLHLRLDSKDLQRERAGAIELLYSDLPLKCKQCGIRFPETKEGKTKMDAHLDSHFRQNRRMKERAKRGLSRSWFVSEDDWIHGAEGELTSHQMPTFMTDKQQQNRQQQKQKFHGISQPFIDSDTNTNKDLLNAGAKSSNNTNNSGTKEKEQLEKSQSLENAMVVMPHDGERKPCPVCGEPFVDVWNDEEEEWMYKNAVIVGTKIYHATCHADAINSGTLVMDMDVDVDQTDSTLGVKRKLEDNGESESKLARADMT